MWFEKGAKMFDAHIGGINLTGFIIIFSMVVVLPSQILLCFKVNSLFLRLVPIILSILLIMFSVVMYFVSTGWDLLIYILFGIYGVGLAFISAVGWGVSKVIKWKNKRQVK